MAASKAFWACNETMQRLTGSISFALLLVLVCTLEVTAKSPVAGPATAWQALEAAQRTRFARTGLLMDSTVEDFCFGVTLRVGEQATDTVAVARDVRPCQGGLDPIRHRDLLDRLKKFEITSPGLSTGQSGSLVAPEPGL